jgi:hypothetical protein
MEQILWDVAIVASLLGFLFLIFAFLTGLRIIKIKPKFRAHKKAALAAFGVVSVHALIMFYFYFFA